MENKRLKTKIARVEREISRLAYLQIQRLKEKTLTLLEEADEGIQTSEIIEKMNSIRHDLFYLRNQLTEGSLYEEGREDVELIEQLYDRLLVLQAIQNIGEKEG